MAIRVLSPLLVNQIAAGEVIERPASVVKELVENSLDAGARRIEVVIEDGGRQLIRVADDGQGIVAEELPLAIAPHATSKIAQPADLEAIGTMGFRGEALASVASVSRLRITSRTPGSDSGATISASGDEVTSVIPAACAPGSVVEVRDLFFNTPARRKFMRSAPTEFGHVNELLERIAMVRPEVAFKLVHNERVTFELAGTPSRRERCLAILGRELEEGLLEFEEHMGDARVWGLAGAPSLGRATAKFQYLCLNRRPIRDRNLAHAIREAYRGLMAHELQPLVVVFVQIDPAAVDVNVHPAKAEVRLRDPQQLHGLVLSAIRQRLLGTDLTPTASLRPSSDSILHRLDSSTPNPQPPAPLSADSFVDYFRRMDPKQKGFVFEQVSASMREEAPLLSEPARASAAKVDILQVHQSYVVTQDEQGLVIVDQHALHERVMFEELWRRVVASKSRLESQRLLMPVVLRVTPKRAALLETLGPLLERIGVELSPLGPDTLGVQAFPSFLFDRGVEPAEFLSDLLDRAEEGHFAARGRTDEEAVLHQVIDMMACKAAVKAGDRMTPQELAALLAQRDEVERSSSCPHGRPTTIRLTLRDLEKHFKRS